MMRRKSYNYILIVLYVVASLCIINKPQSVEAKETLPKVSAHAYVVMDANSGEIIFSENQDLKIYPASTVKLMTAIIALENMELSQEIKVESSVLKKIPADTSKVGLRAGNTYTMEQLLNLLLIASSADAAETLSVAAKGSSKKFIKQMNERAIQLGLFNTSFDNTMGLDIGNKYNRTFSTASDITELARYAMSLKEIREIVSKKTYTIPKQVSVKNTNRFYSTFSYNTDRYQIIGTKTGSTNAAGFVLISTARDKQGHEIICAFFGNKSSISTYEDTRKLLDCTFKCYNEEKISLSLSYYDARYRASESEILQLCSDGILPMSESGEFNPTEEINQECFVDTINQICSTELKAINTNKKITVKDLATILYNSYPTEVSEGEAQKYIEQIEALRSLTPQEVLELNSLYDAQILPDQYIDNVDKCITREDMILIAVKLKDWIKTWEDIEMLEAS